LRQCLAEHQTVLEMVMNKFRRVSAHAARLERDYSTMADQNGLNEIKVILKDSPDPSYFIFEINVGQTRIRPFPTLISKIKWLESELPLIFYNL